MRLDDGGAVEASPAGLGLPATLGWSLLESVPDGVVVVDDEYRIRFWNAGAERILGWSAADVLGELDPSLGDEQRPRTHAVAEMLLRGGDTDASIATRTRRDGRTVHLRLRGFSRVDLEDGPGLAVFFRVADDLERRQHQRNELSRALVDAVREEQVHEVLHAAVVDLLDAERAFVLQRCEPGEHLHGVRAIGGLQEDAEQIEIPLDGHPASHVVVHGEVRVGKLAVGERSERALFVPMGPSGEAWVLALTFPNEAPTERPLHRLAQAVADEAWLALQRAQLVSDLEGQLEILEATAAVASAAGLDLGGTVQSVLHHAATALSCERAAIYLYRDLMAPPGTLSEEGEHELDRIGFHATDLKEEPPAGSQMASEVLQRGDVVVVQDVASCEFVDGPWHPEWGAVSVFGLPLRVADRELGVLVVAHTENHPRGFTSLCQQVGAAVAQQAALALEHARLYSQQVATLEQLRELDVLKAEYVAGITHDLKAPLTGLVGFVQTLKRLGDSVGADERRSYLQAMERQSDRLVSMVEDLLLAAKMDAGHVRPNRITPVDLGALIEEVAATQHPDQMHRVEIREFTPVMVPGDPTQLMRVVANLIDNGLKYSGDDMVEIELTTSDDGHCAEVRVRDHGPGIRPEDRQRIFDRFQQGPGARDNGSTGLGLYISRGIARGHDGDLVLEPVEDGEGALFRLILPTGTDGGCGSSGQ